MPEAVAEQIAVRLDGIGVSFDGVQAVAPLSLSLERGESVALLGPSGAGKTTLLRMIGGEIRPSEGRVTVHGRPLIDLRPGRELASLTGIVAQQFDLVPTLSAMRNTLAGNLGRWGMLRSAIALVYPLERAATERALARVGMAHLAHVRAGRLSGGEQQRVAIARALVQDPLVLLTDEPVASLDPARSEEILDLLIERTTSRGRTLVASMHSVKEARSHFSRLIGLRNGSVRFDSPSDSVTDEMLDGLYELEGLRNEA